MYKRSEYLINQTPSLAQYIIMVPDPQAHCVYFSFENLLGSNLLSKDLDSDNNLTRKFRNSCSRRLD